MEKKINNKTDVTINKKKLIFAISMLTALIVASGSAATYFAIKASRNGEAVNEVYIDPSLKSNFEISELKDVTNGKEVSITSKNEDKLIDTVSISIGNDLLKLNEEYSININKVNNALNINNVTKSSCTITIFKAALSSHKGTININPTLKDKTFTVTFDSDGGSIASTQTIKKGDKALEPNSTKDGYTLIGWFNENIKFDFKNTPITSNISLKAKWKEDSKPTTKYTVTYINEGKTYLTQVVEENTRAKKPETDPIKEGHTFLNWIDKDGNEFNFATVITDNLTLTAKYSTIATYTVSFNTDGGSEVSSQTINYKECATKPDNPTKEGYTFIEWRDSDGIEFNFKTPIITNITLTAHWEINKYTVTFDTDGGNHIDSQSVEHNKCASKPTNPTKAEYTFIKWVDTNGHEFNFSTPITANTIVKATWKANYEDYLSFTTLSEDTCSVWQLYEAKQTVIARFIDIPKTHAGQTVIATNDSAFSDNGTVCIINVPNTIEEIGPLSFSNCKSLTAITFENNSQLKTINGRAFQESPIREIELPDSIESFGTEQYCHFYNCTNLYKVKLPSNSKITVLPSFMFEGCTNLEVIGGTANVVDLSSICTISKECFLNCTSIKKLKFSANLKTIDVRAFANCTSLSTIDYSGTMDNWKKVSRGSDWHANVPATTVTCSDGTCGLDEN